jgi:hypothetical protein
VPAYLYLITHKKKSAYKVGIGNTNAKRLEKHIKNGWTLHKVYEFSKGLTAHSIEQGMIEWLRVERSLGPAFRSGDGWTETVPANEISLATIYRKMVSTINGRGKKVELSRFKKS